MNPKRFLLSSAEIKSLFYYNKVLLKPKEIVHNGIALDNLFLTKISFQLRLSQFRKGDVTDAVGLAFEPHLNALAVDFGFNLVGSIIFTQYLCRRQAV